MNRDWMILLMSVTGALAALAAVIGLCLLPGYMMDSGRRECLRWLRSPPNQEALRNCAEQLLRDYPNGSAGFDRGIVPAERLPDLIRHIPPPRSGWCVVVKPAESNADWQVQLLSLGGFSSCALYVCSTNVTIDDARKIAPGIYFHES
jgi:hypothetical protein